MVSDTIITGTNGRVKIILRDDTLISLGRDSELSLTEFADMGESVTFNSRFLKGTLGVITGKIAEMNPEGFMILTPHSTMGIRGTVLSLRTDERRTILYVLYTDKTVIFNGASVNENYKAVAETGKPPRITPLSCQEKETIVRESDLKAEVGDKLRYLMTVYFPFREIAPTVGEAERKMFAELDNLSCYFLFGHTDDVKASPLNKRYADNFDLSFKRAEAVKEILTVYGKSSENISTEGLGAAQPAVENRTSKDGTLENRRVEIFRKN
jgi:hypothetical protein